MTDIHFKKSLLASILTLFQLAGSAAMAQSVPAMGNAAAPVTTKSNIQFLPSSPQLQAALDKDVNDSFKDGRVIKIDSPEQLQKLSQVWKVPGIAKILQTMAELKAVMPEAVPETTRMTADPTALYIAFPPKSTTGELEGIHPNMCNIVEISKDGKNASAAIIMTADYLLAMGYAGEAGSQRMLEEAIAHENGHIERFLNPSLKTEEKYQPKTPEFFQQAEAIRRAPLTAKEVKDMERFVALESARLSAYPASYVGSRAREAYIKNLTDNKIDKSREEIGADILGTRFRTYLHGASGSAEKDDEMFLFSANRNEEVIQDSGFHSTAPVRYGEMARARADALEEMNAKNRVGLKSQQQKNAYTQLRR